MNAASKLIFLPGAGGNPQFWKPVAERLAHPGAKCLLGWPGFGVIPADPRVRGIEDLVTMVLDEMDRPSALIAQSMGGVVAVLAALRRPERVTHLVLTATSGGVDMSGLGATDWRPEFVAANPALPRWFSDYDQDLTGLIGALRVPVLLLWGDADPISPVAVGERLKGLFPVSTLHVLSGGEHDLANRFATRVAALIDAHLGISG